MDPKSLKKLEGVHPTLIQVVLRAEVLSPLRFVITQGTRTIEEQRKLVASGASRTMNSRHIPETSRDKKFGHAVDFAVLIDGKVRWDWPLYPKVAQAFLDAAKELGVKGVEWGGTCFGPKFRDGPHIQLSWKVYP